MQTPSQSAMIATNPQDAEQPKIKDPKLGQGPEMGLP